MDYQVNSHLNGAFSRTKLPKKAGKGTPRYALTCNGIQKGQNLARAPAMDQPRPYHRMRHDRSILALVVSPTRIFAGTQGGEILVYDLDTFERLTIIEAHSASVLALCLCEDNKILLSSAGDRIIWNTQTLRRLYTIYSTYDLGDIFCVSFSSLSQTVYLGAQNTSIQWYDLKKKDARPPPPLSSHPSYRKNKFFDSTGPGGQRTSLREPVIPSPAPANGGQVLELDSQAILQFAHYGYVYCMLLARDLSAFSAYEEVLISGGGDGTIKIWAIGPGVDCGIRKLHKLKIGRDDAACVFSIILDGNFLYSGHQGGEINIWDLETKQTIRSLKSDIGDVLTLSVCAGVIFCAGENGKVNQFNVQQEDCGSYSAHEGRILASAVAESNGRFYNVTGGSDSTVAIWDITEIVQVPLPGRRNSNEQLVESLRQFVSYRTVSCDPRYSRDCRRGASFLRALLKGFGAVTEMITIEKSYNPVVCATFKGNSATRAQNPRILFYGHYDVIAAENLQNKWITDPFNMQGINGYVYGRGTSDNKGPLLAAIYAVAELLSDQSLDSDIVFLIEGEEECGSRGFEQAIRQNAKLVGPIDWILIANSYWLDEHHPCLTYGLRGSIHALVRIEGAHPDLHSGLDGRASLDEPLKDLIMLLGKLCDPSGKVQVPGFYDHIPPLSSLEQEHYANITTALLQRDPSYGSAQEIAESLMQRWRSPSLTFHRIKTSGAANSSVIPRMASGQISLRLVPNQDTETVASSLTSFLEDEFRKFESQNALTVKINHSAEPWLGDVTNQLYKTLEQAVLDVWKPFPIQPPCSKIKPRMASPEIAQAEDISTEAGPPCDEVDCAKPLYIREGGSISAIRFLEKQFKAPAAQLPCGQSTDSAHLDNERIRLLNLYKSKDIFKVVFRDLPKR